MKSYTMEWGGRRLDLGSRTAVMGVLNITPDSFSDGGAYYSPEAAVAHGEEMAAEGADIIDIGGESTRPFSDTVPAAEEIDRVVPVIETLARRIDVPISIDTMKATVARKALEAGASIINDVSALRYDAEMAAVAASAGVPVILMHMLGSPKTMQVNPVYDDVVREIIEFLALAIQRATTGNIDRSLVIVDPGIGFGKTLAHNLMLLKHLSQFERLDVPVLVGSSRKKFIRTLLKPDGSEDIPTDLTAVGTGTQATVAVAALNGAHIVRVHDVAQTKATVRIVDAIRTVDPPSEPVGEQ